MSAKVACAMIVRDGAASLERCIRSVRPHVAQLCVYENASTDGTPELLERLAGEPGAPILVERGEWPGDYAEARTRSFAMVDPACPWVLWLDADDVLVHGEQLPVAVALGERHALPYVMVRHVYAAAGGQSRSIPRARIVHRGRGCWVGLVHEDWCETRRATYVLQVPEEIMCVRHLVGASADGYAFVGKPPGFYLPLILKATEDVQRTPRAFFFLAREYAALGRWDDALAAVLHYLSEGHDAPEGDPNQWRKSALELGADAARHIGDAPTEGWLRHECAAYAARLDDHMASLERATHSAKTGRNEPCPCGSGRKFKKCHGAAASLV